MSTVDLLKKLVSIPSHFPHEKEVSDFIAVYLKEKGFDVKKIITGKGRPNLIATFGNVDKYLAFYGHMDTVPNNFSERKDPYKVKSEDSIATGLGVEDMKGGIAAIMKIGEYAVENNLPVKLVFGVDEEDISQGAHDLVDSKELNDVDFMVVGESGQVPALAKNFTVCYGRKGRILFIADVLGKKTHAAESQKGINAAEKAAKLLQLFSKIKFSEHPRLGTTQIVVHSLVAKTDSFSIPDNCQIQFSLLTSPGVNSTDFLKGVKILAKENDINLTLNTFERATPYGESYEIDRNNKFLKLLEKEVIVKYKVTPMYTASVADENIFANRLKIPVISLGPIGGGGHTSSEWINLDSLLIVEGVYKNILALYHQKNT